MSGAIASTQAPFDARITRRAMPMSVSTAQITRGKLVQAKPLPGYANNRSGKYQFNYLYNPSTVEATYYIQTSGGAISYLFPNPNDSGDLATPLNQSVSWTVMFDRTFELNMGAYDASGNLNGSYPVGVPTPGGVTADPHVWGVLADVWQLMFFTGMCLTGNEALQSQGGAPVQGFTGAGAALYNGTQGFVMMIPCYAYFGGSNNVKYFGYISEWDVTYTHWTQWMVPMRCVIDITFTMLPPPTPTTSTTTVYPTPTGAAPKPLLGLAP